MHIERMYEYVWDWLSYVVLMTSLLLRRMVLGYSMIDCRPRRSHVWRRPLGSGIWCLARRCSRKRLRAVHGWFGSCTARNRWFESLSHRIWAEFRWGWATALDASVYLYQLKDVRRTARWASSYFMTQYGSDDQWRYVPCIDLCDLCCREIGRTLILQPLYNWEWS